MTRTGQAIVVIAALLAFCGATIFVLPRHRRRPAPVADFTPNEDEISDSLASSDAVMRALNLVQQQYAALVRQYDALIVRNRELEEENVRLRAHR